jgi:hypothetical protein
VPDFCAQVDDVAIGVMGYIVPIGITLMGVYLAYTGFNDVSYIFFRVVLRAGAPHCDVSTSALT